MKAWIHAEQRVFTPFIFRLMFILFFIEFMKGALLVTILPVYMKAYLGLPASVVGWVLALQYAGDNLFRTPMGWLIDRIGHRAGIVVGVILSGVSVWIMATAHTSWTMLGAAALLGIGTSPLWPSVISGATSQAGDHSRGSVMSVVYAAWLSGTGLGPVVINFFIRDRSYNPAFLFLMIVLIAVLGVALFLPDKSRRAKDGRSGPRSAKKTVSTGSLWTRLRSYIARVGNTLQVSRLLYPALFLQNATIGLLAPVLTLYASEVLHLSHTMYSVFLIYGGGIAILLLYPVGKLVDRFGSKWLLHIGYLLGSAALTLFAATDELFIIWIIVAIIGMSYAMIIPSWNAMVATYVPGHIRALVWGFFLTIQGSGMVAGSVVSGYLWDMFGPQSPFFASGGVLATLFVLHLFISKRQKVMVR